MKNNLYLIWYFIEIVFTKMLGLFGIRKDVLAIPEGHYCYVEDAEKNEKEPDDDGGIWIKPCKYYRFTSKTKGIACTYVGFYGFDPCLYDQCKICEEKIENKPVLTLKIYENKNNTVYP